MTIADNSRLSPRKRQAIELLAAGSTVRYAAKVIGMSEGTVTRWKNEPAFKSALKAAEAEKLSLLTAKVNELMLSAAGVLHDFMEDETRENRTHRLRAATAALANGPKIREHHELNERLKAIEDNLNERH